jgi:hypothetical protein
MDETSKQYLKSKSTTYQGVLEINYKDGTITFHSGGICVLRITHLRTPIPRGMSVDLVAIGQVTSYTPMEVEVPQK